MPLRALCPANGEGGFSFDLDALVVHGHGGLCWEVGGLVGVGFNKPISSARTRMPASGADDGHFTTLRECHCRMGHKPGVSHGVAFAWQKQSHNRQVPGRAR